MVFGPAYLDRVLLVDRPLVDPACGPPLDQSVDGEWRFTGLGTIEVIDRAGNSIRIVLPEDWPGPFGSVVVSAEACPQAGVKRIVKGLSWTDDLGGMGAGYAFALGGTLSSALGSADDPTSQVVARLLARQAIDHKPVRLEDYPADWTLLLSSGGHGDKLAMGFRGCHAALPPGAFDDRLDLGCEIRVVAALPNSLAARILSAPGARCRLFAPAMRNMLDRDCPVPSFAGSVDVLCCNRREWDALIDREEAAWRVSILVVTDGPAGSWARFTGMEGDARSVRLPAFPRDRPPRDTNRAGEAFAATLVSTLLRDGWDPASGVAEESLMRQAMLRASAAAALVLDRADFGFPTLEDIEAALRAGRVS
jgi:ribokinase